LAAGVADAGDERLGALDAVVVARLVLEAQRRALRALRRLGELDLGRQVGNDGDRPAAERVATLLDRQPAAGGERSAALVIALVDAAELGRLVVDCEARHAAAAMHLGQHDAAGGNRERLRGWGAG